MGINAISPFLFRKFIAVAAFGYWNVWTLYIKAYSPPGSISHVRKCLLFSTKRKPTSGKWWKPLPQLGTNRTWACEQHLKKTPKKVFPGSRQLPFPDFALPTLWCWAYRNIFRCLACCRRKQELHSDTLDSSWHFRYFSIAPESFLPTHTAPSNPDI